MSSNEQKAPEKTQLLRRVAPGAVGDSKGEDVLGPATRAQAEAILLDVKKEGQAALLRHALRLGDLKEGQPHILRRPQLQAAFDGLPADQQALLRRTAQRVTAFATAQLRSVSALKFPVPGGFAGHHVAPVERAGCYAPGGRFPLPSSVIMTACTARAAGVAEVWVASPRPAPVTLAAAFVAGADALLAVGGAQAIAAFAFGAGEVPECNVVVGPGNRWVTAAKALIAGKVGIDMLAGPSELLIFADASPSPALVAADLLAQAEHDTDALPCLVTTSEALLKPLDEELRKQLEALPEPSRANATAALQKGFVAVVGTVAEGVEVCNVVAPEHLELLLEDEVAREVAQQCKHYGGMFIGSNSAEVLGDYGVGPNHTLPTSGTSKHAGGLSVFNFLRIRTWLELPEIGSDAGQAMVKDTIALARLEGLEGHARSAEQRVQLAVDDQQSAKRQKLG